MEQKIEITNEDVQKRIAKGKQYCVFFYKAGPNRNLPEAEEKQLQMEHLRYLTQLQVEGKLVINGPILDDPALKGLGIFNIADKEEVKRLLDGDPKVKFGWLIYEVYSYFTIPGSCLPE